MKCFFQVTYSFQPYKALGFTQPLTEIRCRKIMFLGSRAQNGGSVFEVNSNGRNRADVVHPPHLRMETDPVSKSRIL
jgi:hypothetical protein